MTTHNVDTAATSGKSPPPSPPPQTNSARLILLMILLGLAMAALFYDYRIAGPGVEAAEKKAQEFVDARNRLGVKDSALVTPDEIHKELGMMPTWVEKHPEDQYEIEYYCWRGPIPVINMMKHYIAIVYIGNEPRRFSSLHKNERPPREALPIPDEIETKDSGALPPPEGSDAKPQDTDVPAAKGTDTPAAKDAEPAAATEPSPAKES